MRVRRIYLPLDPESLGRLAEHHELAADEAPLVAYAVTHEVKAEMPDDDEEEREYDALLECAADASGPAGSSRRVIASADVDPAWVEEEEGGYARVHLASPVPLARMVSLHVDESPEHVDEDLLWYDITELDAVIRLVAGEDLRPTP